MSIISEYVTPFLGWYHRQIEGEYLATQLQYKGSEEIGGDYINKVERYNRRTIQNRYDESLQRIKSPTFGGFFQDNLLRVLLNPFDRLITAYQAYPSLKARFHKPGTLSHTFTEILNEGLLLGAFKGAIFNVAQLAFVLYPAVYFANKNGSEHKFLTFAATYTIFDSLLYPVDTLKSILYADTLGSYSIKSVANRVNFLQLYRGLPLKLAFNLPVLSGIYSTTQEGSEVQAALSWAVAALLFPLNTQKVRAQVSASSLSTINANTSAISHSSFRGVVPFLLLNILIGYSLRPLLSQAKLDGIEHEVRAELKQKKLAF